jgi:hypothetical protein
MLRKLLLALAFGALAVPAWAEFDHSEWDKLLHANVVEINNGKASRVKYAEFKKNLAPLKAYLEKVSKVTDAEFQAWPKPEQLAFLINAYNAFTVDLILTKYPDLKSIKDLGGAFSSPWKKSFIPLLGQTRTLDYIEQDVVRAEGRYNDPRIHFALVCASIGCPALRNEAFVAAKLDAQLDDGAQRFLSDRSRNRYNTTSGDLELSKIFDWYGKDFSRGWKGYTSVQQFIAKYSKQLADAPIDQQKIADKQAKLTFLDYDWNLNDVGR